MSPSADRPILPRDDPACAHGAVADAGVDPTLEGRALQDALRRGYRWRDVGRPLGHAGWVVTLDTPERHAFSGRTLEQALAWCLVWLMVPELEIGPFRV